MRRTPSTTGRVDLAAVRFGDSAFVHELTGARSRPERHILIGPLPGPIARLLDVTGTRQAFDIALDDACLRSALVQFLRVVPSAGGQGRMGKASGHFASIPGCAVIFEVCEWGRGGMKSRLALIATCAVAVLVGCGDPKGSDRPSSSSVRVTSSQQVREIMPAAEDLPPGWSLDPGPILVDTEGGRKVQDCADPVTCKELQFGGNISFRNKAGGRLTYAVHAYDSAGPAQEVYRHVTKNWDTFKSPEAVLTPMDLPALGDASTGRWVRDAGEEERQLAHVLIRVGSVVVIMTCQSDTRIEPNQPPTLAKIIVSRAEQLLQAP
ncbi:hypothetical protein ABZ615_18175 [Streptomyces sp. NPDC007325]|uniref:hypothetical protein n=1 Tax=Streptomyces sp. NPDC007325 TaxID=3154588 RepID=UPI0033E60BEA